MNQGNTWSGMSGFVLTVYKGLFYSVRHPKRCKRYCGTRISWQWGLAKTEYSKSGYACKSFITAGHVKTAQDHHRHNSTYVTKVLCLLKMMDRSRENSIAYSRFWNPRHIWVPESFSLLLHAHSCGRCTIQTFRRYSKTLTTGNTKSGPLTFSPHVRYKQRVAGKDPSHVRQDNKYKSKFWNPWSLFATHSELNNSNGTSDIYRPLKCVTFSALGNSQRIQKLGMIHQLSIISSTSKLILYAMQHKLWFCR